MSFTEKISKDSPKMEQCEVDARMKKEPFWIFGYGSLCWNPGFEYKQSVTGYVKGFSRRFWQGNTTHRGTENKPGRVATLIEDKEGITWGKAFLVGAGDTAALPYLSTRECQLGGYRTYVVNFHPRPSLFLPSSSNSPSEKKDALLYIAVPENRHWLGAAPLPDIAKQILECQGSSGSNVEYLLRLADFMREEIPEALDEHLFSLERLVKKFACDMKVCLRTLMGEAVEQQEEIKPEAKAVVSNYQFASRVPEKKLRCVNM
ncbi:putative glutathione-specific gamma-glutamylcyclotransferase 2 [Pectinophora gossypiella]|uniref:putative glutathione-specific gamma-glutamylcyclotransferase 2 n=1 Tax=Pectinophora gossypiella TaxID=13191 RepID=UPI00214F312E|nr:putative glutathione-specific gamma-glutamylcyclotransferase 2 [Pectinophora gossypiella]